MARRFRPTRVSPPRRLAIAGALITGVAGIIMAVYSVIGGEETVGGALLAASALAFGLLATNLDRTLRRTTSNGAAHENWIQAGNGVNPQDPDRQDHGDGTEAVKPLVNVSRVNGNIVIRPRQVPEHQTDAVPITAREREVLSLVAEGYSNKLISASLGISERTVNNHLTVTMSKLRASDRTHAVITAVRLGWLSI